MRKMWQYAKSAAIAYSHKTDIPDWIHNLVSIVFMRFMLCKVVVNISGNYSRRLVLNG